MRSRYVALQSRDELNGLSLTNKFVTDVKLVKDFHTTNFDQLHAYLQQHELHANEVRIMRECNHDPLALVTNHQQTPSHFNTYQSSYNNPQFQQQFSPSQSSQYGSIHTIQHYSFTHPSIHLEISYPSTPYPNTFTSTVHQDSYPQPQSVPQIKYTVSIVKQQTHLAEFPPIDSGLAIRVFKQGDDPIDAINKMMSFLSTVVSSWRQPRGRSHGKTFLKAKEERDTTWFRDKVLLVEAQGSAYQADDLDAYDSDCDEISTAKAVLMANLSSGVGCERIEQGFLSQKGSGSRRGVKEKSGVVPSVKAIKDMVFVSPSAVEEPMDATMNNSLVAYPIVANYVRNTWGKYGLVRSMFSLSTGLFSFQFRSMDGLDAMLENGRWFIQNKPLILKKWHPDENLLKEDVSTVPFWANLHGVPVTAFNEDRLSAIATKLGTPLMLDSYTSDMCIQSWSRRDHYTCNVHVEYEWKPPRCSSCKVFGHSHEECPKNTSASEKKTVKKPSQTYRGVLVRVTTILVNNEVTSSGSCFMNVDNSSSGNTPITDKIEKFEDLLTSGQAILVEKAGNPLKKVEFLGEYDSEDEVASVDNDMARSMTFERVGFSTQSLLDQWKDCMVMVTMMEPYDNVCTKEVVLPMLTGRRYRTHLILVDL
ncbi:putative dual specificity protein phosphatase DSP8 [Tanacetum coccineum]|uniref:Dual specificity protein phosphatase DSP8 n=1 Tax=Tanacetum coccineum TaxID=301880 RepID=A0ABQ5CRZ7_9ASTR